MKGAVRAYLEYVESRNFSADRLAVGLTMLAGRQYMNGATGATSLVAHLRVAEFFTPPDGQFQETDNLAEAALGGMANLDYRTFTSILLVLDLSETVYEAHKAALDEKIVKRRHRIAHGGLEPVSTEDVEEVHDLVSRLLEHVRTDIQNLAALKRYLRSS